MSTVFEAEDVESGELVAVKVLSTSFAHDPDVRARFSFEADVLRKFDHPHIVRTKGAGRADSGESYIVLELLEGETLKDRVQRGPIPTGECVRIADQLALALAAAHQRLIVHRDVKPANIFLTTDASGATHAKLLDFGICKELAPCSSEAGASGLLGTPEYMAPEQANGANDLVDERTDQYALALVVYEMLTQCRPFMGQDTVDTLNRVREVSPRAASAFRPGVSATLDGVLQRGLAKAREERFDDVLQFTRYLGAAALDPSTESSVPEGRGAIRPEAHDGVSDATMPSIRPAPSSGRVPPRSGTRLRQRGESLSRYSRDG